MNRRDWAALLALLFVALGVVMDILDMRHRGFQPWWIAQGAQAIIGLAIAVRILSGWFLRQRQQSAPRAIAWLFVLLLLVHMLSSMPDAGKWNNPYTVLKLAGDLLGIGFVFLAYYEDKLWLKIPR